MAEKGNKALQIAAFIGFFVLALSGFEYLESGHIYWYKAPLNAAQEVLLDQNDASPGAVNGIEFSGRVTSITDGDTLKILNTDGKSQIIRLYGIDAPEREALWHSGNKRPQAKTVQRPGKNCSARHRRLWPLCRNNLPQ